MFQSRREVNNRRNLSILLAVLAVLLYFLGVLLRFNLFVIIVSLLVGVAACFPLKDHVAWRIGAQGEETVAEYLKFLNGCYFTIHDVVLPGMKGNMDHIVLGPNGIFVIETKHHKGYITCHEDVWSQHKIGRRGTHYLGRLGSPSKQVKRNAILLRDFIQDRFQKNLYVNGLVVFTNKDAKLETNNPTVTVLRPQEIVGFIQNYRSKTIIGVRLEDLETTLKPYSRFT